MAGRDPAPNYQLWTLIVACAVLVALIVAERKAQSGRRIFPLVLVALVIAELPLVLEFYKWGAAWDAWKGIARNFASLPLP